MSSIPPAATDAATENSAQVSTATPEAESEGTVSEGNTSEANPHALIDAESGADGQHDRAHNPEFSAFEGDSTVRPEAVKGKSAAFEKKYKVAHTPRKRRGLIIPELNWKVVIGIGALHIGALFAPFHFSWLAFGIFLVLFWVTGGLGITLCYHRMLTHRSFKTPKWLEYFLTGCACLAWQGGPIAWVGNHRVHHKHSDTEDDPHSPNDGFGWSHMFWCMHKDPDYWSDYAKDLKKDRVHRFLNVYFYIPNLVLALGLFGLGHFLQAKGYATSGLSLVLWGVCLRTIGVYHVTWFVNSATHVWGYRNFETSDRSTNLWWVGLLAWGEGWHNNHHAFQRSAAHGLRWWEFDMTYLTIKLLEKLGLATDVVLPKPEQITGKITGDKAK